MMIVISKITSTKVAPPTDPPTMAPVFPALTSIVVVIASSVSVSFVGVVCVVSVVCVCVPRQEWCAY